MGTVIDQEIAKFSNMANQWWDVNGVHRLLHKMNPLRIYFIINKIKEEIAGKKILDIGCGAGILCEPLSRLGAKVIGIDASSENIRVAKEHAKLEGLDIEYYVASSEEFVQGYVNYFDIITSFELIEHISDLPEFCKNVSDMLIEGGDFFLSTLNRTFKSYWQAIIAVEYLLRWVPIGTHEWSQFVKPAEIVNSLTKVGVNTNEIKGMKYNLVMDKWLFSDKLDVNYILYANKNGNV